MEAARVALIKQLNRPGVDRYALAGYTSNEFSDIYSCSVSSGEYNDTGQTLLNFLEDLALDLGSGMKNLKVRHSAFSQAILKVLGPTSPIYSAFCAYSPLKLYQ